MLLHHTTAAVRTGLTSLIQAHLLKPCSLLSVILVLPPHLLVLVHGAVTCLLTQLVPDIHLHLQATHQQVQTILLLLDTHQHHLIIRQPVHLTLRRHQTIARRHQVIHQLVQATVQPAQAIAQPVLATVLPRLAIHRLAQATAQLVLATVLLLLAIHLPVPAIAQPVLATAQLVQATHQLALVTVRLVQAIAQLHQATRLRVQATVLHLQVTRLQVLAIAQHRLAILPLQTVTTRRKDEARTNKKYLYVQKSLT